MKHVRIIETFIDNKESVIIVVPKTTAEVLLSAINEWVTTHILHEEVKEEVEVYPVGSHCAIGDRERYLMSDLEKILDKEERLAIIQTILNHRKEQE